MLKIVLDMKQILCMKWGDRYGPDYANHLYAMVQRHVTPPFRFICMTDDTTGVRKEVECLPCPTIPVEGPAARSSWRKLALWQPELDGVEGEVLFLDLDVVVVDSIDDLFTFGAGFCVMRNWTQPRRRIGNTSVFRFTVGAHPEIWNRFAADPYNLMEREVNEQMYISRTIDWLTFFPAPWCLLFKVHCVPPFPMRWLVPPRLPKDAKVVAFPGDPNPPDAAVGRWPALWHKRLYKHIRPTAWVREHWR